MPGQWLQCGANGSNVFRVRVLTLQGHLAYKNPPPLIGPYSRTIPRVLWWSSGGGLFLMSEVPLQG